MNNDKRLKIGLIGLGNVARVHLEAYQMARRICVVAAADPRQEVRDELSGHYGFTGYSDYLEMIERESLDAVCVLTPAASHEEIVVRCALAGLHVLCEKPMALTVQSGLRMVEVCREARVKFCYGSTYRYLPALLKAREVIREGVIGKVKLMREELIGGGDRDYPPLGFAHYPKGGPGGSSMGLVDHGVHLIDAFRWLAGDEIVSVSGRGNISGDPMDTEIMIMNFDRGATGMLSYNNYVYDTFLPQEGVFSEGAGWALTGGAIKPGGWHCGANCIHLHGDKGAMRIFYYANVLLLNNKDGLLNLPVKGEPAPSHFARQIDTFAESIMENTASPCPGEEGVAALAAIMGVYESQKTGKRVDF